MNAQMYPMTTMTVGTSLLKPSDNFSEMVAVTSERIAPASNNHSI